MHYDEAVVEYAESVFTNRSWGAKPFYISVGFSNPHLPWAAYERHFAACELLRCSGPVHASTDPPDR